MSADRSCVFWHRGELPTALSGAPCLKWRVINTCGTATDTGDSRAGHLFIEELEGLRLASIVAIAPPYPFGDLQQFFKLAVRSHVICIKTLSAGCRGFISGTREGWRGVKRQVRFVMWDARERNIDTPTYGYDIVISKPALNAFQQSVNAKTLYAMLCLSRRPLAFRRRCTVSAISSSQWSHFPSIHR